MNSRLYCSGLTYNQVRNAVDVPADYSSLSHLAEALLDPEGRQLIANYLPYHTEGKALVYGIRNEHLETIVVPFFAHKLRLAIMRAIADIEVGVDYLVESDRPENHLFHYLARTLPEVMSQAEAERLSGVVDIYYPGYDYTPEQIMLYLRDRIAEQTRVMSSTEGLSAVFDGLAVRLTFTPLNEPRD